MSNSVISTFFFEVKFLIILFYCSRLDEFDEPMDGLVYGATAALGFAMAENFDYVYNNIKKDVHLASISGGTDVVGCLVLGNIFSNVYSGEIQGESLGIDIDIFDDKGKKINIGSSSHYLCPF